MHTAHVCTCIGFSLSHSCKRLCVFCSTTLSSATTFICRLPTWPCTAMSLRFMISLKAPHSPDTWSTYTQLEGNWKRCRSRIFSPAWNTWVVVWGRRGLKDVVSSCTCHAACDMACFGVCQIIHTGIVLTDKSVGERNLSSHTHPQSRKEQFEGPPTQSHPPYSSPRPFAPMSGPSS